MALNHSLVGTAGPPIRTTINAATLSAWAAGLGGDGAAAGHLAGLTAAAAVITPVLLDPRLGADMMRLGQTTFAVTRLSPLAAGDVVDAVATIVGVTDTEAGERLDLHLQAHCRGAVVVDASAGVLLRGPRKKTPLVEAPAPVIPHGAGVVVDRARVEALCAALDDHNPLFVDEDAARQAGLPGCVAPNLGVFAVAWQALGCPAAITAAFKRPALVDDVVTVERSGTAYAVVNQVGVVLMDGHVGGAP